MTFFRSILAATALLTSAHAQTPQPTRQSLATAVLERYATFTTEEKAAAISGLASQAETARVLMDGLASGTVARSDISSFVARQILELKNDALKASLEKNWGKVSLNAPGATEAAKEAEKWKLALTPHVLKSASVSQGRVLFKTICGTCHTLFGDGGKIGPDLTGSNRADLGYVLENVTNPNAILGKDYEIHILSLKDGRSVAGMVSKETDSALTVQTMTSVEVVAKTDISEHTTPGVSMMPPGLLAALEKDQVRDLVAYLASPKQVPLPGQKGADNVLRVPGAIEGETIQVLSKKGNVGAQGMGQYTDSTWSGNSQLWWTGGKPGDQLSVNVPVTKDGDYELMAVLTRAVDYGVVKFLLDDKPLSQKEIDLYGSRVTNAELTLGKRSLKAGDHKLTIEITGANPQAVKEYMFGLDYVKLVPAP